MPEVYFNHPYLGSLIVETGANMITWGYGLNTIATPTYGGEVVQVLSAYTDQLQISGDVKTYEKMEEIYKWFLKYMQIATQAGNFNTDPVTMDYPERGWTLKLKPTGLPGFKYATDIVAPTWQLQAYVVEEDPEMNSLTMEQAIANNFDFTQLHAGIGYDEDNPFTDPAAKDSDYNLEETQGKLTDFYSNLIPSYLEGDFTTLSELDLGSKPAKKKEDGDVPEDGGGHPSAHHEEGT